MILFEGSSFLRYEQRALRRRISSVSAGTISRRSPTMPKSAKAKMGASGSLLMATMQSRCLHAGLVLDGAGDAAGDIEPGRHGLARLPHLHLMLLPAGVDHRSAGRHRGAELIGQSLDECEVLLVADTPATGHYHRSLLQAQDPGVLADDVEDLGQEAAGREVHGKGNDLGLHRRLFAGEGVGPHGGDQRGWWCSSSPLSDCRRSRDGCRSRPRLGLRCR